MEKIKPIHIITVCLVIIALASIYLIKGKVAEKAVQEERIAEIKKIEDARQARINKQQEHTKKVFGW